MGRGFGLLLLTEESGPAEDVGDYKALVGKEIGYAEAFFGGQGQEVGIFFKSYMTKGKNLFCDSIPLNRIKQEMALMYRFRHGALFHQER